ncbi:anti-sigma factor [Reyranella sp. CPCC 100927]|uniref:anti-sigma factor family protein n=1 Tax=Reyranella sp. CPCC 100927 TaxID=2599616 RepID=UPI0011B6527A|nr:anti-sigma factor [Reyranella sp. CPCC 100927]TWT11757.1 anti-sigma factor [Reyranella sp. CPCC 100927]
MTTMTEMDCATCESLIDAYADGELSADMSIAIESALPRCPHCQQRLDEARLLRDALRQAPSPRAPAALRTAILDTLAPHDDAPTVVSMAPRPTPARRDVLRWAATVVVALTAGWAVGRYLPLPGESDATREVVDGYLRVTSGERLVEVASSDRHTVKPWFGGRVAYAPPVHDLTTDGFPLVGGRVDVIDGRKTAVLVYRRNRHVIALFLWPDRGSLTTQGEVRDGFGLRRWSHAGFTFHAIADLPLSDLDRFAAALGARLDAER